MTFATSNRDKLLDALVAVLRDLDGVRYVDRQAVTPEMVGDQQLPAILIDEGATTYRWVERHGRREMMCSTGLVLDLQIRAQRRTDGGPGDNASTARETFVAAVLQHLADYATLDVQLPGEAEATEHALDVANQYSVRYARAAAPYARALITIRADTIEVLDGRVKTNWQQLILSTEAPPDVDGVDPITSTYALDDGE